MMACVSPADSNLEETISTLRYADRARKIKNKPIVNKDPKAAELSRLRSQVQQLQLKLLEGGGGGGSPQASSSSVESETEKVRLAEQNCQLNLALQAAMEENAHLNEKLLMSELCQEKMKEKLAELEESVAKAVDVVNESKTEEGALGNNMEAKNAMTALKLKVAAVQELLSHSRCDLPQISDIG